jgi:Tfp pilus assembly protein PilE
MKIKMQKITEKNRKGFTIIELIVVIAVFMFVIGAAIGIFLSIVRSQKRILAEQEFLNQISYAEEYMSKGLRMAKASEEDSCIPQGYIYSLTRYQDSGKYAGFFAGIKFINQSDDDACQEFFLDNSDPLHPAMMEKRGDSPAVAITSFNLQINSARFSVNGSNGGIFTIPTNPNCTNTLCGATNLDGIQPRATILLNVIIPGSTSGIGTSCNSDTQCFNGGVCDLSVSKCVATRTIQTTVSQRNLNLP